MRLRFTVCTYVRCPYLIVLDNGSGCTEEYNTAVRRAPDEVVPDEAVLTAHADAVCPFLERICTARPDVVVLHRRIRACEWPLCDVQARPAPGVKGADILDELKYIIRYGT